MTLKIGSRSPRSIQLFPPSQQWICASLVKICPLVQKITCGNKATRTPTLMPTGSAPKTICPPLRLGGHNYVHFQVSNETASNTVRLYGIWPTGYFWLSVKSILSYLTLSRMTLFKHKNFFDTDYFDIYVQIKFHSQNEHEKFHNLWA